MSAKVEITQADRRSLAVEHRKDGLNALADWIESGKADDATHRYALRAIAAAQQERAAIVEWMRSLTGDDRPMNPEILVEALAQAIEAQQHLASGAGLCVDSRDVVGGENG